MKTTGHTTRDITINGQEVAAGTPATQIALTGEGKANYCVEIPGVGRRFLSVSAVR